MNKSNQVHIILHASLFFVKYILVRKYILNYKLKNKILTMKGWRRRRRREIRVKEQEK